MPKRRCSLVPGGVLARIVRLAVERSLGRPARGEFADRLTREVVRGIRGAGRSVRGMSPHDFLAELERSNHELVQVRDRARAELEELQRRGDLQRRQIAATHEEMLRIVDGGAGSREEAALAQVDRVFARAKRGVVPLDALHEQMSALVLEAARRERRELLDGLCAERDRQIDRLERRIAKLNRSLELSESALRELAARKDVDPGLASIYRTVQGLSDDEAGAQEKRAMLQELFLANLELRGLRAERAQLVRATQGAAG